MVLTWDQERENLKAWETYLVEFERLQTTVINYCVVDLLDDCEETTDWSYALGPAPVTGADHTEGNASLYLGTQSTPDYNGIYYKYISSVNGTNKLLALSLYIDDTSTMDTSYAVKIKIGSDASNYYLMNYPASALNDGWNELECDIATEMSTQGSPDITDLTLIRIDLRGTEYKESGDIRMDWWRLLGSCGITSSATAISGVDVSDFPNQGYIQIGDEIIMYTAKTGIAPGCFESVRGCFGTIAASSTSGAIIREPFDKYWGSKINIKTGGLDISNDRALLDMPKGIKGKIEPDEGRSSLDTLTFKLTNKNNIVSKMTSLVPMRDRMLTLWAGYENIPATAYEQEFVGLIKGWKPDGSLEKYEFSVGDLRRTYKKELFSQIGKARITNVGGINSSVTSLTVTSTDGASAGDRAFTDPADSYDIKTYLQIDDEIMGPVTSMSASSFTVTSRGVFGTQADSHSEDADISEAIVFDGRNPITMILQILTSTGSASANGPYDVLPAHCGFGVASGYIDFTTFENERDEWTEDYQVAFCIKDSEKNGKEWLEKELLRMVGGYIITLRNGILSLRMYHRQALADSTIVTADDIIKIAKYNPGHNNIINQTLVKFSPNPLDDKYRELWEDIDADSISKHGASPMVITEFKGLHGDWSLLDPTLDGLNILGDFTARMLGRYQNPAPEITLQVLNKHRNINTGDIVAIVHDALPDPNPASGNPLTGRGVNLEEYEVVARKLNYSQNNSYVEIDLLRAIYAEGQQQYYDYIYRQYLGNSGSYSANNIYGAAIQWVTNRPVVPSTNKIRLRCYVAKESTLTGYARGCLVTTDYTVIYSDANIAVSSILTSPSYTWITFEFTPGAAAGKDILYLGFDLIDTNGRWCYWRSYDWGSDDDLNPDTRMIQFNPITWQVASFYPTYDRMADVAEKLF